jgi:hypothetical protein
MNIFNFSKSFPEENACIAHFKAQREQNGVVCLKCGSKEHYWLKGKLRYECKHCHYRQSLRSGTVLEYTKLPFSYRYVAMHLLTSTKKSFSAAALQRQPGHKRYQPVWEMLDKLRDVMGKHDNKYRLGGQIELDNAFIITLVGDDEKDKPLKRGSGSQNEFCYKFNRRYFGELLFDRLVMVASSYQTDFRSRIYNRSLCG